MKKLLSGLSVLLMLSSSIVQAAESKSAPSCEKAIASFLTTPSKQTYAALSKKYGVSCWGVIRLSNTNLNRLIHSVEQGNLWAAQYLAQNLKSLGGGNLEDSLISLGQFSEHNMEQFFVFARDGKISKREFSDALTMLPLTLSDDRNAQLRVLKIRKDKATQVVRKDLVEQNEQALKAINDFMAEIRATQAR